LLKDKILEAGKVEIKKVKVKGVEVHVKQLTYGARMELEKVVLSSGNGEDLRQQAILHCTCDADGNPVFSAEDLPDLMSMRHDFIDAIFVEIDKVNGLTAKN